MGKLFTHFPQSHFLELATVATGRWKWILRIAIKLLSEHGRVCLNLTSLVLDFAMHSIISEVDGFNPFRFCSGLLVWFTWMT